MNKLTKNDTVELVNPTSLFCSLCLGFYKSFDSDLMRKDAITGVVL